MERDNPDKQISAIGLPRKQERNATQQPEEFIDKGTNEKDKDDTPRKEKRKPGEHPVTRKEGKRKN